MGVGSRHVLGARGEALNLAGADLAGPDRLHDRGLGRAAMDAVGRLVDAEMALGLPVAVAVEREDQQFVLAAQLVGDDIEHRRVAAVAVQHGQLAEAGRRDTAGQFHQHRDHGFRRQAERAGEIAMLDADADRQGRQHEQRHLDRQPGDQPLDQRGADVAVDRDRQMRPVLLGRRDRQQDHRRRRIEGGELLGRMVGPIAEWLVMRVWSVGEERSYGTIYAYVGRVAITESVHFEIGDFQNIFRLSIPQIKKISKYFKFLQRLLKKIQKNRQHIVLGLLKKTQNKF